MIHTRTRTGAECGEQQEQRAYVLIHLPLCVDVRDAFLTDGALEHLAEHERDEKKKGGANRISDITVFCGGRGGGGGGFFASGTEGGADFLEEGGGGSGAPKRLGSPSERLKEEKKT